MRCGYWVDQEWPNPPFGGADKAQNTVDSIVDYIMKSNDEFAAIMNHLKGGTIPPADVFHCKNANYWYVNISRAYRMLLRPVQLTQAGGTKYMYACLEIYDRTHVGTSTEEEHRRFLSDSGGIPNSSDGRGKKRKLGDSAAEDRQRSQKILEHFPERKTHLNVAVSNESASTSAASTSKAATQPFAKKPPKKISKK